MKENLNKRPETIKTTRRKCHVSSFLTLIGLGLIFIIDTKVKAIKAKTNNQDYIKLNSSAQQR